MLSSLSDWGEGKLPLPMTKERIIHHAIRLPAALWGMVFFYETLTII
jgi:hypothetical protein